MNRTHHELRNTPTCHKAIRAHWPMWIEGRPVDAASGEKIDIIDPADGAGFCTVASGSGSDVDAAVAAASHARLNWASLPASDRGRLLHEIAHVLHRHKDELAYLECRNAGKPLGDARRDVDKTIHVFEFYAGSCDKLLGSTIPVDKSSLNYTVLEPVGVTAHIAPWNYPLRLAMRSVAPALAAGNTVVLKPAEQTPLTALRVAECFAEAGLPAGVYNVVTGLGTEAGAALAKHTGIHHLSFTGSVPTGMEVMRGASGNVVPVTLELGGKSPNIVFADADIDSAVEGALKAIFTNAGQVCCAGSRLFLQNSIHDALIEMLLARTRALTLGPGLENPDMGPLISATQRDRVQEYVRLGEKQGGTLLCGGGPPTEARLKHGFFFEPTLMSNVSNSSRFAQEEIFGPVLAILRFDSEEEVVQLANDNPYGLVAGVWTTDVGRAHRMAAALDVGQVYINDFFTGSVACPFGGCKQSGFGRERGIEALQNYTRIKSVTVRLKA